MRLLLDTHILLWWFNDDPKLRPRLRQFIAEPGHDVLVSLASLWEIAIKRQLGKMEASAPEIAGRLAEQQFELLPIGVDHLTVIEAMPRHHGDPFDHLLIAQAMIKQAAIVTIDVIIPRYGVPCIGVA
ncbi:MAG TPA: type II toxin-antitoxin system VapC family toxin [Sphingomonas sp.]|nr:type II toxin-antitoxin system VapC family toxin [Sphingomonas sp.]